MTTPSSGASHRVGVVLGGGGKWGAVQVGMLSALVETERIPEVVVGCSIGAINGAAFCADPTVSGVRQLRDLWTSGAAADALRTGPLASAKALATLQPALFDSIGLRRLIERWVPARRFDDLSIPFSCVAASIEEAAEHWFDEGPLVPALLASSAIPGLFPPVEIGGRHYYDGGLVNSVPVDRLVEAGVQEIFVLQVGRVEQALRVPRRLHESAMIAFEIARRHRYVETLNDLGDGCRIHVLPAGAAVAFDDPRQLRWRDLGEAEAMITAAESATREYLDVIDRA